MTAVGNKIQFDHCPVTHKKLGADAMILIPCAHPISEDGLKTYYTFKKIAYDWTFDKSPGFAR